MNSTATAPDDRKFECALSAGVACLALDDGAVAKSGRPPDFSWAPLLALPGVGAARDAPLLRRVIHLFLSDTGAILDKARIDAGSGDRKALIAIAHRTKSAAAAVGAMRLAEIASELEAGLRGGEAICSGRMVWRMAAALSAYRDELLRNGLIGATPTSAGNERR